MANMNMPLNAEQQQRQRRPPPPLPPPPPKSMPTHAAAGRPEAAPTIPPAGELVPSTPTQISSSSLPPKPTPAAPAPLPVAVAAAMRGPPPPHHHHHHQQQQHTYLPPPPSSLNNSMQQPLPSPSSVPLDMTSQSQSKQPVPPLHPTQAQQPLHMPKIQQYNNYNRPPIPPPMMPPQISQSIHLQRPTPPTPPSAQPVGHSVPPLPNQYQYANQQYQQQLQQPHQQQPPHHSQHWQQHSQNQYSHPSPPPPLPSSSLQYPQPPPPSQYHHQQPPPQQHLPHPPPTQHLPNEREKIDPTQIPRIPLFTRPHHAPATIYPTYNNATTTTMDNVRQQLAMPPPPSDSRYVVPSCNITTNSSNNYSNADYHHNVLVSPRIMRSTVHTFPVDNTTLRKCGDLPLGLVISPLAGLTTFCDGGGGGKRSNGSSGAASTNAFPAAPTSTATTAAAAAWSSQWNGREQGEMYGKSNTTNEEEEEVVDYIPLSSSTESTTTAATTTTTTDDDDSNEDDFDPERIPVIRNGGANRVPLTPPRCDRCQAYLNPFCTPSSSSSSNRFNYNTHSAQNYNCNICGASSSITISEEYIMNGTYDAATRCSTVEYEVGGAYNVRKEGPVQNVHLYGVEYVPPPLSSSDQNGGRLDQHHHQHHHHHHHHGNIQSHGWHESLNAIREVAHGLSTTAPPYAQVSIGLFAFYQDMLVFPYLMIPSRPQPTSGGSVTDDRHEQPQQWIEQDFEDAKLAVAIVSDVTEDPISPLPLHLWTYDMGKGLDSIEWKRFNRILDSFTDVMEQLLSNSLSTMETQPTTRNCGGAALAALADALYDSGGRATLITTRRPNYGVGALADREKHGTPSSRSQHLKQSPYRNESDEQILFTPLQHLSKSLPDESIHAKAGHFYRQLGEQCAMQRVCIDIVVASSLVTPPPSPTTTSTVGIEAMHPNVREFLDVATLAELCRNTCGKFKWLRVGNECGVAVGDGRQPGGESFTCEQLREELKRSALAYSGSDVVFKLRCSSGVQVKSYCPTLPVGTLVGDGIVNSAELELSSMNSGASIALLLEHKIGGVQDTQGGRRGIDSPMVFFQSAVLYTTMTGRRRVRVSTMGLITTKVPADVYRSADLGTVAAIMTRQAISDLEDRNEGSLNKARTNVFQKCVEILANYRMHTTARTSPEGQLVLPESLQLLPLFCLSLRKSRLLRNSSIPFKRPFPSADERAYHIFYGRMATPYMSLQCVHPNLFQLSDMRSLDGEWIAPPALETNLYAGENAIAASMRRVCQLPKSMNPSIACLDEKGMYILDDRFAFYLFIGKEVPEEHWKELLSVSKPSGAHRVDGDWVRNVPMGSIAVASTESGPKLRNILRQLRALNSPNPTLAMCARHTHAPLILVFVGRGSVFEEEMDSLLVDDPDDHEKSYVDFLCDVHRALRQKMANT